MATDKTHKIPNAPNLRFPEFDGEWRETSIGDVADVIGGGTPDTTVSSYWDGDISWFTPTEIGQIKYVRKSKRTISEKGLCNSSAKLLPHGAILLTTRATIGEASIALNTCTTNQGFQSLISKSNIDNEFLYYLIGTKKKDLFEKACGSTFMEISANEVRKVRIKIPTKQEQVRIAKFLAIIDDRIEAQIGAIEKLKSLISSLNDKLQFQFCNEVNLSFSEIGNDYSGLSGKSANDFGRGKPYIPYTNIYANTFVDDSQFDLVEINEGEHQCRVLNGDVLFTLSSEVPEEVCVGSVYLGNEKELYLNSFCFGVHINSNKIHSPYLAYFVKSSIFRHTVYPLAQGSTRFNLQKSDFLKRKFSFPNIEHQIKIANVLMAIDSKLKIEQKLLEQYKLQKQYLLSQMFI